MSSPGLTVLPDVIQGSDEWHTQRRGMITASVVAQLITITTPDPTTVDCTRCGAHPGHPCVSVSRKQPTPIKLPHAERTTQAHTRPPVLRTANNDTSRSLTLLLAAERITDWTDPTYINNDMLRGIEDEPRAIQVYADNYHTVDQCGFMIRDDDWGFSIGYSPDGLVGDDGLIEVKSRRQKKHLETILADAIPPENMAQLQCGLLVTGRKWADYVSYCGGMPLWVKRVEPDPAWFDAIIAATAAFEETVARMLATYAKNTTGLAPTERVIEQEIWI